MYIAPSSTIKLFSGIPIDPGYDDTIYFNSKNEQEEYFNKYLKYTFGNQSYTRVNRGVVRINQTAENLYDCNYMGFINTAFSDAPMWFYCFIDKVEYINNVTSDVYFTIDVLQTWHFNYDLSECFVEREHSISDDIGENLVEENIEHGDYMLKTLSVPNCPFTAGDYKVVIARAHLLLGVSDESNPTPEFKCVVSNVFNGISYTEYGASEAYQKIKEINDEGKADEIVAIFTVPSIFWGGNGLTGFTAASTVLNVSSGLSQSFSDIDGYVPRNKKLFTSPYFGLAVHSSSGDSANYGYEYFANPAAPVFGMSFCMSGSPNALLIPNKYKGTSGENATEAIACTDFPLGAYATDAFKAYLAQNAGSLSHTFGMVGVMGAASIATGGVISVAAGASAIGKIGGLMTDLRDKKVAPNVARGKAGGSNAYVRNKVGFQFYNYHIKAEFAKIIDNYFQMFGYACRRVKVPNRNARPRWNYVKTIECDIHGNLPADDSRKIREIYDKGVRWWKPTAIIGYYDTDNSPV